MKAKWKALSQSTQEAQAQQQAQLRSQLQEMTDAKLALQAQLDASNNQQVHLKAALTQLEEERSLLKQQLSHSSEAAEKLRGEAAAGLEARNSELSAQIVELRAQVQHLQQQQSSHALELTAQNSGLLTQLSLQQQQHAEALSSVSAELTAPLEKELLVIRQQLKLVTQKLQAAEQQLSAHEASCTGAEARAAKAEGLLKKSDGRRSVLECDKRRLQTCVKEVRAEVRERVLHRLTLPHCQSNAVLLSHETVHIMYICFYRPCEDRHISSKQNPGKKARSNTTVERIVAF